MLKKLLASLLLSIFLLATVFVPYAKAEGTWYNPGFFEWRSKVYSSPDAEIFGERYTAAQVNWVIYSFANFILTGGDPTLNSAVSCFQENFAEPEKCKDLVEISMEMPQGTLANNLNSGEESTWNNPLQFFASRSISGIGYFINKAQNLNLIPEAKAQGFGFESFNIILVLWKAMRNIAYGLTTLALVIIAFMVMFRVKISPQAVITAQSALPKLVIGLILITFSYAIAGFLVDLMYVFIGLVAAIIRGAGLSTDSWGDLFRAFVDSSAFWYFWKYWILLLFAAVTQLVGVVTGLILLLLTFFAFFIFLVTSFKIIFVLLKSYIQIMLLIVFSPFFALLGIVSTGFGFGDWLRQMMSNLLVFPLVGSFFFLAFYFLAAGTPLLGGWSDLYPFAPDVSSLGGAAWNPPLINFGSGPIGLRFLSVVLSFGIILLVPKVVNLIKSMIERKPFDYGTAIGEALGPATTAASGYGFYSAGQIGKGRMPAPFGKMVDISNVDDKTLKAVSNLLETLSRGKR